MPWIGLSDDGTRVAPEQVADGRRVTCPDCGGEMFPRGPTVDGKARHFTHAPQQAGSDRSCDGNTGESDTHRRMKSQAISAISQWYPETATLTAEQPIDTSMSASAVDTRQADVELEFAPPHPVLGEAVAIEVQYKNHSKPIEAVTHDYIVAGYSVYWAFPDDFTDDRFCLSNLISAFHQPTPSAATEDQPGGEEGPAVPTAVIASETSPRQYAPQLDTTAPTHEQPPDETSKRDEADQHPAPNAAADDDRTTVVSQTDGSTKTIPRTVPEQYLRTNSYPPDSSAPETTIHYPDREVHLPYAALDTHPPAEIDDSVPRTTADGHPIPQIPDCNHSFPHPIEGGDRNRWSDNVPCQNCGTVLYAAETHYILARPYNSPPSMTLYYNSDRQPYSSGDTQRPYCGDRVWEVDFAEGEYRCTTCGRSFPQSNDALREKFGQDSESRDDH